MRDWSNCLISCAQHLRKAEDELRVLDSLPAAAQEVAKATTQAYLLNAVLDLCDAIAWTRR